MRALLSILPLNKYPKRRRAKMGRQKLGNGNAQRNNNKKRGKTSSELVEFSTTEKEEIKRNRPLDQ